MPMDHSEVPVLICGGGPVGLALAVELGLRGIGCVLVESGDGAATVPKMTQIHTRSMEFCRRWGIAEEVKKAGWPGTHPADHIYLTCLVGYELCRWKFPSYAERGDLGYTPEGPRQCPQIYFDPILLKRAASLPMVHLRHRTRLDSLVQDSDKVEVQVTNLSDGRTETIVSSYLIGCDGFDGPVRKALAVKYVGSGTLSFSVSIYFRSRELATLHDKGWARFYRPVDGAGHWGDLIAIDGRELWRLTLFDLDPNTDIDSFDVEGSLLRLAGVRFPYELISVMPWKRRELVADRYREDRVFIAGDAAHQCSPTGGLGMNTGLADAVDIGWKLAAALEGWGGSGLLDSYESERRPVAVSTVSNSTLRYRQETTLSGGAVIAEDSPEGERLRREFVEQYRAQRRGEGNSSGDNAMLGYCYEDSPIIWPDGTEAPPDDPQCFVPTARPGTRAPHAWIGEDRSTLDLFGTGFVLLRFGRNPVDTTSLEKVAAIRKVPFRVVDIDDLKIAELYERKLVLVRPDSHVAWRDDVCPDDPGALVDRVRGAEAGQVHVQRNTA